MDEGHRQRLIQKAELRRRRALQLAEDDYLAAIHAIDRVFALDEEDAVDLVDVDLPPATGSAAERLLAQVDRADGPIAAVRRAITAIAAIDGEFASPQIRSWLMDYEHRELPGAAVSSALHKLHTQGEIVQVRRAAGREPAMYTKAEFAGLSKEEKAEIRQAYARGESQEIGA